jgi:hypothetical protein
MRRNKADNSPTDRRRTRFLLALRELDDAWVAAFHKSGFGDVYFSRLFTELWLRDSIAVSKTAAYDLVKGVSLQTAMKYVNKAIADGYLEEVDNPADGRSRLLRMSPLLHDQFAQVIDRANAAFMAILSAEMPAQGLDRYPTGQRPGHGSARFQVPRGGAGRRAMKSTSTRAPRASAVTPMHVRAGSLPGSK